ncbi:type II secretion system inner membrane protein GspF [Azoarcus sp. L1K30]|uniref:type II secretion system inner membrane protein GspF n=1 Tax=Azoarcus sp. L1K30 TaxID=2820277 RepID=UPI001B810199|nr:type II secretion system inner membrane protein GspF [Azoarcus sp. L1K30]MBR0565814.1 type II secretion system inner membrane protein GspF [Azoarcus sp. L1K30]
MTAFHYRALDASGQSCQGVLEAESMRSARVLLRERGLFPLDVSHVTGARQRGRRSRRLKAAALALLTRQWATLLAAGLTLEQALAALIEQAEEDGIRQLLAGLRSEILAGYSLRAALDRYPAAFPAIYRASIAAGEKSGELATVMNQLADYLEQHGLMQQKTTQALVYPVIVAVVALLVVIGLMTHVVPQVIGVFAQTKQALPPLTRGLIAVSNFLRDWGWLLLLVVAACGLTAHAALRNQEIRRRWESRLLAFPVIGRHLRTMDASRFASTLSILTGSGVPLLAALEAGGRVIHRLPLRDAVDAATARVREGQSLARALGATRAFPPLLVHMIASGEATGRLDELLSRAARLQQQELETRGAVLASLLEPALLVAMGGIVLVIVIAVMQPIIEINTLMK